MEQSTNLWARTPYGSNQHHLAGHGLRWLAALLLPIGAGGCVVGPEYHAPEPRMPAQWSEWNRPIETAPLPSGNPTTVPSKVSQRPMQIAEWWATFHDPMLDALIAEALHANYDLRLAQSRVLEARAQRAIVAGGQYPLVNANASYVHTRISQNGIPIPTAGAPQPLNLRVKQAPNGKAAGGGNSNAGANSSGDVPGFGFGPELDLYQVGFDASWEVDLFGGIHRQVQAATADLAARVEDQRSSTVTLLAEVAREYLGLRGLQRRLAIARDNLASDQQTLRLTRERRQAGLQNDLDVSRAESQVASTAAQLPTLDSLVRQSVHRLSVLLGREPGALARQLLKSEPLPVLPAEVPVGLPSQLLRRRPDIARAERELAAATYRTGAATADLFPRFSLTGALGLQSLQASNLFDGHSAFYSVGPSITWPILEAGRIRANIAVQNARQQQAALRYEQTVLTALREVEDALVAYSSEQFRRQALSEAVAADKRAVAIAQDQYRQGVTDFLTVLDAQRTLFRSEDALAQSDQMVDTNLVALYKALGGGWEVTAKQ